jgi:hypothetical protein
MNPPNLMAILFEHEFERSKNFTILNFFSLGLIDKYMKKGWKKMNKLSEFVASAPLTPLWKESLGLLS